MTRTPKTVGPDTKIAEVQKLMNKHKIHNVLVVDSENHLLGIVDRYACVL
jgi:arabinose-5-phosphate isomerase